MKEIEDLIATQSKELAESLTVDVETLKAFGNSITAIREYILTQIK